MAAARGHRDDHPEEIEASIREGRKLAELTKVGVVSPSWRGPSTSTGTPR